MNRSEFRAIYGAVRAARRHNESRAIANFCGYSLASGCADTLVAIPAELAGYDFSNRLRRPMIRDERAAARRQIAKRIADARACYQPSVDAYEFAVSHGLSYIPSEPQHPNHVKERLHAEYRRLYARISA